ncbi:hypothetical protein ACF09G_25870 [Streptomyces albogriseolus]
MVPIVPSSHANEAPDRSTSEIWCAKAYFWASGVNPLVENRAYAY